MNSRGNRRQPIFLSDADYALFLRILAAVVSRFGWECRGYCLMPNHYHLVIRVPDESLSAGMQRLNAVYAHFFNERHGLNGHVFQGRFHSVLVKRSEHSFEVVRYVELNPIRAGLCIRLEEWPWSSYRALAGIQKPPPFLAIDWVEAEFGASSATARAAFVRFVREG